jgi:nicotinate-nucleotide adenylyltransferase
MARIGVYSGTFDPAHSGHLAFATAAVDECGLDLLYMLVEENPWRKSGMLRA